MSSVPAGVVETTRMRLAPLVDRFRRSQADDGSVPQPGTDIGRLLDEILGVATPLMRGLGQPALAEALAADIAGWHHAGLDTRPCFDRTRDAFEPPSDGATGLFVGPVVTTNGPDPVGHRLECLLAVREEPPEIRVVAADHPHPANNCQSLRLLAASAGFRTGNCIVLFPENVAAVTRIERQRYALFLFNKFQDIYTSQTLPAARRVLDGPGTGRHDGWASERLRPAECYRARSLWGYLHDVFHHRGPRPLDQHLRVKTNWYVGLLEEIKVDAQSVLACLAPAVPFGQEVIEFVLLERMFRYPLHPAATRNFDAGTGVLLFSWLRQEGVLRAGSDATWHLDWYGVPAALGRLVAEIEAIEAQPVDDATYKSLAEAFVRRFLRKGAPGERFALSSEQHVLARNQPATALLDFTTVAY